MGSHLARGNAAATPTYTMHTTDTDEALMQGYVSGDVRGFDALFTRYASRLHGFFMRTFHDGALADDLVQTTFLKVHAARASYDAALPVRPWLFSIAVRVRIDALRQRARPLERAGADALEDVVEAHALRPDVRAEHREEAARVEQALATLSDAQRLVLVLHRFDGLPFVEIAQILSEVEGTPINEGAVRVRAFRAMAALRTALEAQEVAS